MSRESDIDYLVAKGLPEVYAVMAVDAPDWYMEVGDPLSHVIINSFTWYKSDEGHDFWQAIHDQLTWNEA